MPPQLENNDQQPERRQTTEATGMRNLAGDLDERESFVKRQTAEFQILQSLPRDDLLNAPLFPDLALVAPEAEVAAQDDRANPSAAEHAGVTVYEHPATQAGEPIPPLSDALSIGPYDSPVKLNVQITQVPEVSQGVQNFDDLRKLATGVGHGLVHVGQETLNYLATPGSVENSLLQIGSALDNAVNYYANAPPEQVLQDAQKALSYAGQALEDSVGHPLKPEQRGEYAGEAMPAFFSAGTNKALTEKELEALGGAKKLGQMTEAELEDLNIRKVAGAGGNWRVINERPSPEVVPQTDKMSCVQACGDMVSEGAIDQLTLIEQMGSPAPTQFLARHLGPDREGKAVRPQALDKLLQRAPWVAELREPIGPRYSRLELGHAVVLDGLDEAGNIMIRDPAHGTRYEMTRAEFMRVWTYIAVFKK